MLQSLALESHKIQRCMICYVIQIIQGLKVYKYDWMSVCQFTVPHRDPSLLPRQWRMALGTQKSYKLDAEKKEKRRLYEFNKRKCKSVASATGQNKEVYYPLKLKPESTSFFFLGVCGSKHLNQVLILFCCPLVTFSLY